MSEGVVQPARCTSQSPSHPSWEVRAPRLPELPGLVKGPAYWKRPWVGTTRMQNRWHMDIKSKRWHSMTRTRYISVEAREVGE